MNNNRALINTVTYVQGYSDVCPVISPEEPVLPKFISPDASDGCNYTRKLFKIKSEIKVNYSHNRHKNVFA